MREIKFRAKDKKGSWHYGMLTYANFNQGVEEAIAVKTELGSILIEKIDKNTIGQFTGLYDKNSKEIYEGDIVRYTKGQRSYKSTYCTHNAVVKSYVHMGISVFEPFTSADMIECNVIGDIYDNPELIKE